MNSTGNQAPDGSPHRVSQQVRRVLERAGLREESDTEAEELQRLLLHRFAHELPGDAEVATDALEIRRAFLHHRFTRPVIAYERGDRYYGHLDTTLNLISIAAGVSAALVAALQSPKWVTIALGVLVAGCQTLSQWLKPSQRAARRGSAATELRGEAWDLLQHRDRYRGQNTAHAWDIFCDQVDRVENREEAAEDNEAFQAGTAGAAADSATRAR